MSVQVSKQFGVNLWWTVPEFVMDGDRAQEALAKHGFEKEDMPLPTRRNVVSRAAYSFQDRRHKDGRRVTEKAKDSMDCVVYGILNRARKADEEVAYNQSTKVRLDKASGRVEVEGALKEDFLKALEKYDDAITDDDVRLFLRRVVRMCKGISKRPTGGIYFVPEKFVPIIESAKYVIDELQVGAKLYLEGVVNGQREREIVWEALETDIESQIDATLKAVERIEKRASSVQSHDAKLSEMGELVNIYRDLLGQEAKYEELAEKLEEASNQVAEKLDVLKKNTPSRAKKATGGVTRKRVQNTSEILAAAHEVLKENGVMHFTELAMAVEAKGVELRETASRSKGQWLALQIYRAISNGNKDFANVGKGLYEAV
jgi:hypothetical protein